MPTHQFDLSNRQKVPEIIRDPEFKLVHIRDHIRLRRADAEGVWDPDGTYESGSVLLQTWRPGALVELTGFCGFATAPNPDDRVLYRLSADEGATHLWWDGLTWAPPVDDAEWNTEAEIDAGIGSFPMQESISVLLRLETSAGITTPVFEGFVIFWEARYDPSEDILRSLHKKIVEEAEIEAELCLLIPDDEPTTQIDFNAASMTPDDQVPIWEPVEPISVYNRGSDPALRNDVFGSLVDGVITLTTPQTGELLVRYRGRLDRAHVSTDADFERERLPAVVINNLTEGRVRDFLLSDEDWEEPLRSRGVARLRTSPCRHDYSFQLQCISQNPLHDKKLGDAIRRAFDTKEYVRSIALDEDFTLTGLESVNQVNQTSAQVFMRIVLVTVSVWEWLPAFTEVPLATQIILRERLMACPRSQPEQSEVVG